VSSPKGIEPVAATNVIPRVALSREEAARALGISLDSFERYVQPHVRIIRLGRMRLVAIAELEDWARSAGERAAQPPPGHRVRSANRQDGPAAH
jgi:hypothetical protein